MTAAPQGTVTLVFTDVQGSTLLWDLYPDGMHQALQVHNQVLRTVLKERGGYEVRTRRRCLCPRISIHPASGQMVYRSATRITKSDLA